MKLKNIFKKSYKNTAKAQAQVLDKKQLEKVIGGTETTSSDKRYTGAEVWNQPTG